jgi:hypothetical protein
MAKRTANEEKALRAQNEARDGFSYPVWFAETKMRSEGIYIEAEKFFDARAFACRFFGVPEVEIEKAVIRSVSRWQVRIFGDARNSAGHNAIRMQTRKVEEIDSGLFSIDEWTDVRDM